MVVCEGGEKCTTGSMLLLPVVLHIQYFEYSSVHTSSPHRVCTSTPSTISHLSFVKIGVGQQYNVLLPVVQGTSTKFKYSECICTPVLVLCTCTPSTGNRRTPVLLQYTVQYQ